jgi:hypothetical protein
VIDETGLQPVPLRLVIRRVGQEAQRRIAGAEVRAIVAALYEMFAVHIRPEGMAPLWARYGGLPAPELLLDLVSPLN